MTGPGPFVFHSERRIVRLTARTASTLPELIEQIASVSGASIFFHTHQQYLSHHFQRPAYYNDFAAWLLTGVQEAALAEKVAVIDLLAFSAIRPLREAILDVLRAHPPGTEPPRQCQPGSEFHFCESQSFVLRTGLVAHTVPEFFAALPRVTVVSLYYHFFEARLRLGRPTNDFSTWLRDQGATDLATAIDRLDPYASSLDQLKADIVSIGTQAGEI
ncbi:MAG: DUF5752 family protein [Acidobacteriota bacterium]